MTDFFKALANLSIKLPYSEQVEGLQAQLIWQFLRFNPQYRSGYDKLKKEAANDDSGELPAYFAQSWCLSTAVDYNLEVLPEETSDNYDLTPFFEYKPIRALPKWKYLKDWGDITLPDDRQIFILNPHAPMDQVTRFLSARNKASASQSLQTKRQAQLIEYVVCHYFLKIKQLGPTEFSPIFHDIFKTNRRDVLQSSLLKPKVDGFIEVAALSPWCFFTPPHR